MKYRPRSCYERSPQSFGGLRSDRSAAQPGRPPGLGRSSRNDASITDRANTRAGKAKRAHHLACILRHLVGTALARLCPPYGIRVHDKPSCHEMKNNAAEKKL